MMGEVCRASDCLLETKVKESEDVLRDPLAVMCSTRN